MKIKKAILNYAIYYILGNIIFNVIFAISKTVVISSIVGKSSLLQNLKTSFMETFIFYTVIFVGFILINIIYKKNTIHKLNQRLNQVKERSEENEK